MKIEGIDFPRALISAIRDRELVVFAGAGVSMGEPAGLPSFVKLANRVAEHTGQSRRSDEPIDAFLGRLERGGDGVDVHARAVRALARRDRKKPEPTDLHRGLLSLYQRPEQVRLVTTNFDELFEEAALRVFKGLPEVFRAPALPLGSDFSGVVHLHGSVREPKRMVLTDRDFGRAYLTEGWARGFVLELFQAKTVLFVGYSHEDVVVSYLARALPPVDEPLRFALVESLTDEDDLSRWRNLGVEPISYPQAGKGDHDALPVGVRAMSSLVHRGALEWRRVVHEIAASPPPVDQETNDELMYALERPESVGFFTETCKHIEWIAWLEKRGCLDRLFDDGSLGRRDYQFAGWLLRRFASDHAETLFAMFARYGYRFASGFWSTVLRELCAAEDFVAANGQRTQWVSLLLETEPRAVAGSQSLLSLAEYCAREGLDQELLRVFGLFMDRQVCSLHATRPRKAGGRGGDAWYEFERFWGKHMKPCLPETAELLLGQTIETLERRQELWETWLPDDGGWDLDLCFRAAIELHAQDLAGRGTALDIALDVARDCLDWLGEHAEKAAGHWCDRLIGSSAASGRRLAVHGVSARRGMSADERIDWLLSNADLHEAALRHEVFRVAKDSYSDAGDERRQRLVERVLNVPQRGGGEEAAGNLAYMKYNWLVWLEDVAPQCRHIEGPLNEIRRQYPHFKRREHPDLNFWTSERSLRGKESIWSADSMLEQEPERWVSELLSYLLEERTPEEAWLDHPRLLPGEIGSAAGRDPRWGVGVANALLARKQLDLEFWPELLYGLQPAEDSSVVGQVLSLFKHPELQARHYPTIARVLRFALEESRPDWLGATLPGVLDVAVELSAAARSVGPVPVMEEAESWVEKATGGAEALAMVWVHALEALRGEGRCNGAEPDYIQVIDGLTAIVEDRSEFGVASLSALARHFGFLLAVEERWTREHLLPLFAVPAGSSARTDAHEAVWDGFLSQFGLDPSVAEALGPASVDVAASAGTFPKEKVEAFLRYGTKMMVYFLDDPLARFVPSLLKALDEGDLVRLANEIETRLLQASSEDRLACWRRWLKQYWLNRLDGVPRRLTAGETAAMFDWLPRLPFVFQEAVDVAVRMPVPVTRLPRIGLAKLRTDFAGPDNAPPLAKLALRLSEFDLDPWNRYGMKQLLDQLLDESLPNETVLRLKTETLRWGPLA